MDDTAPAPAAAPATRAYSRSMVDDFLAAAALERGRLVGIIEEADQRTDRAHAEIGMHEAMLTMLIDAQRDLAAQRVAAEQEAADILAEADREARRLIADARRDAGTDLEPTIDLRDEAAEVTPTAELPDPTDVAEALAPGRGPAPAPDVHDPATGAPRNGSDVPTLASVGTRSFTHPVAAQNGNGAVAGTVAEERDAYFEFLRGALNDDEPLGPRPE